MLKAQTIIAGGFIPRTTGTDRTLCRPEGTAQIRHPGPVVRRGKLAPAKAGGRGPVWIPAYAGMTASLRDVMGERP